MTRRKRKSVSAAETNLNQRRIKNISAKVWSAIEEVSLTSQQLAKQCDSYSSYQGEDVIQNNAYYYEDKW